MHRITQGWVCAVALAAACAAQAQSVGPRHTVYAGVAFIDVRATMAPLSGGPALPAPGATFDVRDATTVGLGYSYRFHPSWSVEIAAGLPPVHKVDGGGVLQPFGQIAAVEQAAPTAFLNYHFGDVLPRLSPFVGLGLNYTRFTRTRSTASGDAASGGPTQVHLSDSWGLAGHAGLGYALTPRLSLIGVVSMADVKSNARTVTPSRSGVVERATRINFRPLVYTLSLGYSF